jgi:glycosidase
MQWTAGPQAGFSNAIPDQKVNSNYVTVNVAAELEDTDSILNFYKKAIAIGKTGRPRRVLDGPFELIEPTIPTCSPTSIGRLNRFWSLVISVYEVVSV